MYSILAMVCVLYSNGVEHCDVRTKRNYAETMDDCNRRGQIGVDGLSLNAVAEPDVVRITQSTVECTAPDVLANRLEVLPMYMEATGKSYVLTEY